MEGQTQNTGGNEDRDRDDGEREREEGGGKRAKRREELSNNR